MTQHQIPQTGLPYPGHTPPKRSKLWLWITLAALASILVGLAAYGFYFRSAPSQTSIPIATVTIQGDITVPAETLYSQAFKGGDCTSDDGYTDIAAGAQVTITNQSGTVIHTGTLGNGHTSSTMPYNDGDPSNVFANKCSYHFLIEGVPGDATNYGVSVGNTFRGTVHFTREQLATPVDLNLG